MPPQAIMADDPDYCLPIAEFGPLLVRLSSYQFTPASSQKS
jgi:hypothetical protein